MFHTKTQLMESNRNDSFSQYINYSFKTDDITANYLNKGREAETLLYYIITHYNNLPDITIFLQGDPRSNPVVYTYDEVINEVNKEHKHELKNGQTI